MSKWQKQTTTLFHFKNPDCIYWKPKCMQMPIFLLALQERSAGLAKQFNP